MEKSTERVRRRRWRLKNPEKAKILHDRWRSAKKPKERTGVPMGFKPRGEGGGSIVTERFAFLQDCDVRVVFNTDQAPIEGIFLDILPAGKTYLLRLFVNGKSRMFSTDSICEIAELDRSDVDPAVAQLVPK